MYESLKLGLSVQTAKVALASDQKSIQTAEELSQLYGKMIKAILPQNFYGEYMSKDRLRDLKDKAGPAFEQRK